MRIGDIKNIKIARKYANALFESAQDNSLIDKVYDDIVFVVENLNTNQQLSEFLYSPLISINDKKDVVNKIFSIHIEKVTLDFLFILLEAGRFDIIEEVLNQYSYSFNTVRNIVKPIITSAVELDENQKQNLLDKLAYKLNKKVEPEYVVDSGIIGGLVIEIGDKTIDCSLKAKFDNIKKQLTKGNNYGND